MFKSVDELKAKCEFIAKGSIFPRRIIKCAKRKMQHNLVSGSNQWFISTKSGYLAFVENNDGMFDSVAEYRALNGSFKGSPYHKNGITAWQGNHGLTDSEFLKIFNRELLRMNNIVNFKE